MAADAQSALDVVIVNFNTREDTLTCLRSLQAAPPRGLGSIWVVDNASTDGSAAAIRQGWPAVQLIELHENVGFGRANNVALARAEAPLVLLLNSDTIVPPEAIDALVARLEATGAVAAGPRLVDGQGRPEVSFGGMLSPWAEARQRRLVRLAGQDTPRARRIIARLLSEEREVDWATGACLLIRREAARAAGFFDERYFLYEEDVDLCAALRARGGRIVFTPLAQITHLRGRSGAPRAHAAYDRSHLAFYEKHVPHWAPWLRWWLRLRGRSIR